MTKNTLDQLFVIKPEFDNQIYESPRRSIINPSYITSEGKESFHKARQFSEKQKLN